MNWPKFEANENVVLQRMRALVLLTLALAICVNAGLLDLKSSAGTVKGIIKEKVIDKIEQAADRIKEAFKNDMAAFKKRLSGFRDKILKKLALTKEQRVALLERLKLFKRKSIDKVQPMGDSIEEINRNSKIAGALFQGDMILSKDQEDQIIAEISDGTRSKRQAMKETEYPGKRWHQGVNYFFDSKFSTPEIKSVFKEGGGAVDEQHMHRPQRREICKRHGTCVQRGRVFLVLRQNWCYSEPFTWSRLRNGKVQKAPC
ncbi:hypothetical protein OSTOST_08159 [Ostertagia ostertagi]